VSQVNVEPPESCDADAAQHKISSYRAIKAEAIKQYLLAGTPCLIAIQVYQSFENSQGGIIPMPSPPSDQLLGGHELCVVGYDDASSTFEVQNSWGASWGDAGFCHVPYSYIDDKSLCSEVTFIGL
jgi:C1A family cysteine protease